MKHRNGNQNEFYEWKDTEGKLINAGDGGILFAEGKYHWYGLALQDMGTDRGGQKTRTGVVMYASEDLENWTYEGVIISCAASGEEGPMRYERPKILYNEKTEQYVLWCHFVKNPGDHGFIEGSAELGLAVCSRINGPYRWLGTFRPDGIGYVRDLGAFVDDDKKAYLIYDRHVGRADWQDPDQDRCLYMIRLTEDYLSFESCSRIDAAKRREAPVVIRENGYYYMITSGLTSWDYNRARYFRAEDPMGPWTDMGDPCIGDEEGSTFRSQGTYAFRCGGKWILMFERHNTENMLKSSYIWLTPEIDGEARLSIDYTELLDIETDKRGQNQKEGTKLA